MEKPHLSDEQLNALAQQPPGQPLYVVGSNDNDQYVLLNAKEYQKYRALFESDDFDISETYGAQEQALGEAWSAPGLDDYNDSETA